MKRILILTALAATLAVGAIASPAAAGAPPLTDLTVAPDIGRPGDAFTVSGGGCGLAQEMGNQSAAGRFAPRRGRLEFSVQVAVAFPAPTATTTTPNADGDWSVGFTVPPGTPVGVYEVSAACLVSFANGKFGNGPDVFPYVSGTYTVIGDPAAPPAAAVPGAPRFTG